MRGNERADEARGCPDGAPARFAAPATRARDIISLVLVKWIAVTVIAIAIALASYVR
jgi:hypothetical protein